MKCLFTGDGGTLTDCTVVIKLRKRCLTYIQGEDAHGVVLLDLPARPELVERALCHSREDVNLAGESLLEHIFSFSRICSHLGLHIQGVSKKR